MSVKPIAIRTTKKLSLTASPGALLNLKKLTIVARFGKCRNADLRVRLKTSARITKLSQHEADGGEFQERERALRLRFSQSLARRRQRLSQAIVRRRSNAGVTARTPWLDRIVDDFGFKVRQDLCERAAEDRPLIGAVGKQLFEEWKLT